MVQDRPDFELSKTYLAFIMLMDELMGVYCEDHGENPWPPVR